MGQPLPCSEVSGQVDGMVEVVAQVVKVFHSKQEGSGFDPQRLCLPLLMIDNQRIAFKCLTATLMTCNWIQFTWSKSLCSH